MVPQSKLGPHPAAIIAMNRWNTRTLRTIQVDEIAAATNRINKCLRQALLQAGKSEMAGIMIRNGSIIGRVKAASPKATPDSVASPRPHQEHG